MAEAIHDDHSPLARFLRQSDSDDDDKPRSTAEHHGHAAHDPSPSTSRPPLPTTTSPVKRSRRQVAAVERVKYAIATSALLSAKLADALQVYPPLDALEARPKPAPRTTTTASSRARAAQKRLGKGKEKEKAQAADWGSGWETRGQGVTERGVLGSAQAALSGLVGALGRLSTRDDGGVLESVAEEEEDGAPAPTDQAPVSPQDALLATVEDFVAASQELDLRVATALTAIKELECIAHGLGLSDPLPPISRIEARGYLASPKPTSPTSAAMLSTPSRSPRIPSPLGGPSKASPPRTSDSEPSSPPPPLRALALRNALADALSSALDALSTSTSALNALLPSDSPLLTLTSASASMTPTSSQSHAPQASLSELLRHDSLARAERTEVSRWEEGSSAPSASSRPSSVHLVDGVDPFHPTESTFGGIDRRTGESGTPQRAGVGKQHRLRVSLGPHHGGNGGGSGGGSSSFEAVSPGGPSARRKRPVSMGGLESLPPVPSSERDQTGPSAATHRVLLVTLQDRFDDAHDARRGVLWRLLEALDHAESDAAWHQAEAPLDALRAVLARAAADVAQAHTREFPDGAAAADSPASASTTASGPGAGSSARAGAGSGALVDAREKRRRSGYYARPEADELYPLSASSSSAPTWGAPPTPTPAARRPAAYADYAPSSSSSAPPPPRRAALHAHALSVSAVDPALAAHAQSMLLSLRALQAKVRVVLADAAGARVGSATERERVLEVWESVGAEVRRLEGGWRDGRGALRAALGLAVEQVEVRERAEAVRDDEVAPASTEEDEAPQEVGDELNATGAVYATLDSSDTGTDDDLISSRQAMLDAALSASLLPPPDSADGLESPSKEKVFEAVAGSDARASAGAKLSRDERIRRMKEAREALALGRSSLESPVKGASGEGSGGVESQRSMVGELREVLKELNRDKGRADPPSAALPPVDVAPPPARTVPASAQTVATPPPPAQKPLSPPPPPTSAPQEATARASPLEPAHEPLPPPSPTKSIPSPTTQRILPPPPLARRLSQPPHGAAPLATPPRLPQPSPPSAASSPSAPLAQPAARYTSPPPLAPPIPTVPSTPGKQQAPRYVSPPPPSSANRARAGSSTAFSTFSPPGSTPATPGKQQTPRYVAPPPARAPPPAPLLPSPRYSASSASSSISMGIGSPTGPLSPVRVAPSSPLRATAQVTDERREREGLEQARAQGQQQQAPPPPQKVKRPSVQTV
ncbi:hypothetical protein JCM3775_005448 [Rhodotorula graminis]